MRVLVTGGAGYLGSLLCRKLLDKGYQVRCFDSLYFTSKPIADLLANDRFELMVGDIRNQDAIFKALKNVDKVVHLAGLVGDPVCASEPNLAYEINWVASANLVKACKLLGIGRFVFASTCSVYGTAPGAVLSEDVRAVPISLYARAKLECEGSITQDLSDYFILRMGTLYGLSPRMRFDLVVNFFIARAISKEPLNVFGGTQARPFLHVDDAANAFVMALESQTLGIFNIHGGNFLISEIAEEINQLVPGVGVKTITELGDKRDYQVTDDRLRTAFPAYKTRKTISDAVEEIKAAFKTVSYTDAVYNNHMACVK